MASSIELLAREVGDTLLQNHLVLTTVESCTGGWVAEAITSIAGSSSWFERGFVTYSNEAKQELVSVRKETLLQYGAVSREVAREMSLGGVDASRADLAVAVTGIAGPDGGTLQKPVGTVWVAWGNRSGKVREEHFQFDGDREAVRRATVEQSLVGILEFLKSPD